MIWIMITIGCCTPSDMCVQSTSGDNHVLGYKDHHHHHDRLYKHRSRTRILADDESPQNYVTKGSRARYDIVGS